MTNSNKIILDLCGGTGAWSAPYRGAGYDVRNITLPDYDVRTYEPSDNIYGILAAPPCPEFSLCRTNAKRPRNLWAGMDIVIACLYTIWGCQYRLNSDVQKYPPLKFWALENPNGMLKWFLGKPALEFNPYDFGDPYKKKTHLWGWFNTPKPTPIPLPLKAMRKFDRLETQEIHSEHFGKYDRQIRRAITPSGFARAFYEANK